MINTNNQGGSVKTYLTFLRPNYVNMIDRKYLEKKHERIKKNFKNYEIRSFFILHALTIKVLTHKKLNDKVFWLLID